MLQRNTTFILGAGASSDLGFPLGDTLRDWITDVLATEDPQRSINFIDEDITKVLRAQAIKDRGQHSWADGMEAFRRAASKIRAGLPFARSIDTFIDGMRHEEHVEFLSKLAIATTILRREKASPLVPYQAGAANAQQIRDDQLKRLVGSWHTQLSQILYDGHKPETLDQVFEHASFVVFNYDRCLEEFLTISLMRRFAIDRKRAVDLVGRCTIIHPYGQVGDFSPASEAHLPFGKFDLQDLIPISSRIRTFTETMESDASNKIKAAVGEADVIVFMGFGWLRQNMELLQASMRATKAKQVFATTMGMNHGEILVVQRQINEMLRRMEYTPEAFAEQQPGPAFIHVQHDCKALMKDCWLRLTAAD